MTDTLALRLKFGDRAATIRHQLRIAAVCDSPALRSIIAENIERLGGE